MSDSTKPPKPRPMPVTSMPDRCDYSQRDWGQNMKAGMLSSNDMKFNPGKPADEDKNRR